MRSLSSFDGTRIAYSDEGHGFPVILLHGFGSDGLGHFGNFERTLPVLVRMRELCADVFGGYPPLTSPPFEGRPGLISALLQANNRVIVPDMRGFGASDKLSHASAYANGAMARDIITLIDHLRLEEVDVVGVSMGAVTALRLLALRPPQVRAAVLSGIGDYVVRESSLHLASPFSGYVLEPMTYGDWAEQGASILDRDQMVARHPGSFYLIAARAMKADPKVWAAVLRGAVAEGIMEQELRNVTAPVLILNGREDIANQNVNVLCSHIDCSMKGECDGDRDSTAYDPTFQQAVVSFLCSQQERRGALKARGDLEKRGAVT